MKCSHCGIYAATGWPMDDQLQMVADNAWPPSVCGGCWYSVAAAYLGESCGHEPADCPHRVREA